MSNYAKCTRQPQHQKFKDLFSESRFHESRWWKYLCFILACIMELCYWTHRMRWTRCWQWIFLRATSTSSSKIYFFLSIQRLIEFFSLPIYASMCHVSILWKLQVNLVSAYFPSEVSDILFTIWYDSSVCVTGY